MYPTWRLTFVVLGIRGIFVSHNCSLSLRVASALKTQFIADALAMPVHWYYQPLEIELAFPGGIQRFEAAPEFHPSSIMSLHSKRKGGRQSSDTCQQHCKTDPIAP